jgi:hypothetical protein
MYERTKESRPGEPFEMGARFGEASTDALDVTNRELVANEAVQGDPARDDVPTSLRPRELDRVEDFRFNEGELVPASWPAEGAAAVVIAITLKSATGDGVSNLDLREWAFRLASRQDRSDSTDARLSSVWLFNRKPWIESRKQPAFLDGPSTREGVARIV